MKGKGKGNQALPGFFAVFPEVVTRETAQTVLRSYVRLNIKGVDPLCVKQQDAYITYRETCKRIKPDTFMRYFESLTVALETGGKTRQEFWAVPKTNFADGLPDDIALALVPASVSDTLVLEPRDGFYIIDQSICRTRLGLNV